MKRSVAGLEMVRVLSAVALLGAVGCGDDGASQRPDDGGDAGSGSDSGSGSDAGSDAGDGSGGEPYVPQPRAYDATVRRTAFGIAHILADDVPSAAFGQGYTFAEDHVCTLADQIVAVRSERSQFFGPGVDDANLTNDFAIKVLGVYASAEAGLRAQAPEIQDAILAWVTGYNEYLAQTPPAERHSLCRDAAWVRPITDIDLYAYYLYLGELGSGLALLDFIGTAEAPTSNKQVPAPPLEALPDFNNMALGSNGWGIGRAMSSTGRGMLLANPHFPYRGELTWYESQMTVPGELNVYGASLMGVAAVNIGFNEDVAWTHTVSAAPRFTMYRLRINPDNPTQYEYDGQWVDMTPTVFSIQVLGDGGSLETVERTYWSTQYGPMLNAPVFGWSRTLGFAMADANANNNALLPQWWAMNRADGLESFRSAHAEIRGIPWVNTMYADAEGNAWYTDSSAVPNLTAEAEAAYLASLETDQIALTFYNFGIYLLDGRDPLFGWEQQEGARTPGLVPFAEAPQLLREDYVSNANDSHWLTNAQEPLEGFSFLYGGERTARSLRTRMNLRMLEERGEGSMVGADGVFTLEELQATALSNRSMAAELIVDGVVSLCAAGPETVSVPEEGDLPAAEVSIVEACAVMAAWNGRYDLDQAGPPLLREMLTGYDAASVSAAGDLFAVDFDADDAVNTPRELVAAAEGSVHPLLVALGGAVRRLESIGFGASTTLGEIQFTVKGDQRIAWHGGSERDGTISVSTWDSPNRTLLPPIERGTVVNATTDLTEDGYVVNYGNSFVMAMEFTDNGPRGRAFITYSASSDPESPHFADQTEAYSAKAWRDIRFSEAEIASDPELVTYELAYEP